MIVGSHSQQAGQKARESCFEPSDILLVGRESAGVPEAIHQAADARVTVPMQPPARSLNMAVAAAMVLSEALRQTNGFPGAK
jgi:tRNA (cytidine/uridine-2'-O-)-methyltransferase